MISAKVTLVGNLGHEVTCRYTPQGTFVANTSLAVNVGYGDNKGTDWYKLIAWGKVGERFNEFCQKGTRLLIVGDQRINKWTDKEGVERVTVDVTVSDFNVLARGREKSDDSGDIASDGEEFPF